MLLGRSTGTEVYSTFFPLVDWHSQLSALSGIQGAGHKACHAPGERSRCATERDRGGVLLLYGPSFVVKLRKVAVIVVSFTITPL